MTEATPSRRTVLKSLAAITGAGGTIVGGSYVASQPSVAVETEDVLEASDVRTERNDGELDAVAVAPELAVEWSDFGGGLDRIGITLGAAIDGESGYDLLFDGTTEADGVTAEGDNLDAVDGALTLSFERIDITTVGDTVTEADFGADLIPGEVVTTTVELTLRVDVVGTQNAETQTAFETVPFDVTLRNPEGEATASGSANTDVE
ncbi:twin-arginine translocation signal domain-containing protein [Natronomonas halophila]|uniref:twin-arginine translocation signal domain-containing protein n=1 Tax=Natronomonas halophila TaxID=2747817 RepID=UPI0015B61E33|nr:twin-arginine translocation signal domain-containing protein [Natronomonas halophila]QLD87306.1 twin-arginine translocation signal domain-containing protein [Natronomonas halophila]